MGSRAILRGNERTPRHARARTLSNKMNNDRADGHCIALPGHRHSVTPTFLSRIKFYLQVSPKKKYQCWKIFVRTSLREIYSRHAIHRNHLNKKKIQSMFYPLFI